METVTTSARHFLTRVLGLQFDYFGDYPRRHGKEPSVVLKSGIFILVSCGFLFFAKAADAEGIVISPAFQEIVLKEGQASASGTLSLTNTSAVPQQLELYALDIRQTDNVGQIAFMDKPVDGNTFTLATYVNLPETKVNLEPNQQAKVPFSIRNGVDLSPGGHYGAIIARLVDVQAPAETHVLPALSSLLLVRKEGGERYNLSLQPIEVAKKTVLFRLPKSLELTFSNEGNIHTTPRGTIEVKDIFGRLIRKGIINEGSAIVLPQSRRTLLTQLRSVSYEWPIGVNNFTIKGHSEPGDVPFDQSFSSLYISPIGLGIFAFVLTGIGGAFFLFRKKR